jgi:hypothetical protein
LPKECIPPSIFFFCLAEASAWPVLYCLRREAFKPIFFAKFVTSSIPKCSNRLAISYLYSTSIFPSFKDFGAFLPLSLYVFNTSFKAKRKSSFAVSTDFP